ncbi:MAG: hypothetical protein WCP32_04570 [Bacteroidota bacterium]
MKTKLFPYALIIAMIAFSAIFVIQGCKKSVGPFDPSATTYMYTLRGQVVDARTNVGIPEASVKVFNKVISTDVNGYFTFKVSYATIFPFMIYAEKQNYILGNSLISGPAQVRAVGLTMQNAAVSINETGGTLTANSAESVSGKPFEMVFPVGSLDKSVGLSVTPLEDFYFMYDDVSSKSTGGLIDLATVSVTPYGESFLKPVSLYCPLPFSNDKGTQFPVLRYESSSNTWINTGKTLVVDESKTGGHVEITQGGIYSVACEGTFTEEIASQSFLSLYTCQGDSPLVWQAHIDYPQGLPSGISETWLKNAVSHNTVIGGHVSFLKKTSTSIVCDAYQPGSSNPIPSDEIQILGSPFPCPSGTSPLFLNNGVTINNRIINSVLSFSCYTNGIKVINEVSSNETIDVPIQVYLYQCPHDQGGGK